MNKVLDTNVLLDNVCSEGIVLYGVLTELDRQKSRSDELGYKARRAIRNIEKNDNLVQEYYELFDNETVDDYLIRYCLERSRMLVSRDLSLVLKARTKNCEVILANIDREDDYDPMFYLNDDESMAKFFNREQLKGIKDGSYVVVADKHIYKVRENEPIIINRKTIKNIWSGTIHARNIEQECLIDSLYDKDFKVVVGAGGYGSGKTFLMLNYALQELEQGRINKIVVVGNNSQTADSRELAALPGGILEKELVYLAGVIDIMGTYAIEEKVYKGQLEIIPMATIRGRNLENSIIYINEAQNLTESHIKLLLGRVGEGSRIFFDGDIKQTDSYKFKEKNGLKLLAKVHEELDSNIISYTKLKQIERSDVARLADKIDELF
jgi:predicted ribonuclease YlaK